jgi:hypothetical protein
VLGPTAERAARRRPRVTRLGPRAPHGARHDVAEVFAGRTSTPAPGARRQLWCWGRTPSVSSATARWSSSASPVRALGLRCDCGDGVCSGTETQEQGCAGRLPPGELRRWALHGGRGRGELPGRLPRVTYAEVALRRVPQLRARADGALWCWGSNGDFGQLGDGTTITRPARVSRRSARRSPGRAGRLRHLRAAHDGSLWCWGQNSHGQIGDGTTRRRRSAPRPVTALGTPSPRSPWAAQAQLRAAPRRESVVLGGNLYGSARRRHDLRPPPAPCSVTTLGTTSSGRDGRRGRSHSCARRTDGSLWCWGSNGSGQLGDGTTIPRLRTRAQVTALGTTVARSQLARIPQLRATRDGSLWCWGEQRLASSATARRLDASSPCRHGPRHHGHRGRAGRQHLRATRDGTLWCWGSTTTASSATARRWQAPNSPVAVTALGTTVAEIAVGRPRLRARGDGSLWCWGVTLRPARRAAARRASSRCH